MVFVGRWSLPVWSLSRGENPENFSSFLSKGKEIFAGKGRGEGAFPVDSIEPLELKRKNFYLGA
jgi:hypothetical protein